jgi:hypothetical protein
MLRQIRRVFSFFFLVFSFYSFSFSSITYNNYSYTSNFYDKLKNMSFWVIQHYNNGFFTDALIPFRVKLSYGWDTVLVFFKGSDFSNSIHLTNGSYDYYDSCSNYQHYVFSWDGTFIGLGTFYGDNTLYCNSGKWISVYDGASIDWKDYLQGWRISSESYCMVYQDRCFPCGSFVYSISGVANVPASSHRVYCMISDVVGSEKSYMLVNPVPQSVPSSVSVYVPAVDNVFSSDDSVFNSSLALQNNQYNLQDLVNYLSLGYIDGSSYVVGTSSPYTIDVESSGNGGVGGSSTTVVNVDVTVDLSTTNKKLQDIYDFMRSTYVDQSDLDTFSSSVNQTTNTIHSIFSHFQNFFHTTSSDTWDCSIDFSSIPVMGFTFYLGKFDLCSNWGWVFDLLRKLLMFSALVISFYIVGGVD